MSLVTNGGRGAFYLASKKRRTILAKEEDAHLLVCGR